MSKKPSIFGVFIFLTGLLFSMDGIGQNRDTVLNTVISKPFFYNIIKGVDNTLYVGTSEGVFEIQGITIRPFSTEKGYITTDKAGKPILDKNGIKFHRGNAYSHLLPYPEMGSERSYYVGLEKLFYLCSGGRLYVFDITAYQHSYENHSIRSISKDLIATYSGIYLKNNKMSDPAPPFTDGYVRQIGDRGFVSGDQLLVLEKEAMNSGQLILGENCFYYTEPQGSFIRDIILEKDGRSYYIATSDKLIKADYNFGRDTVLFQKKDHEFPLTFIPGASDRLFFTTGQELQVLYFGDQKIKMLEKLEEPIQDGVFIGDQVYLITSGALFRYNSENKLEELTQIEQAHTLMTVLGDQLLISSNLGLFHYNLVSNTLSVVIKNVEFNRAALFKESNPGKSDANIYAGSINGLYTFRLSSLPELIESNQSQLHEGSPMVGTNLLLIICSVVVLLSLGFSTWTYRRKLTSATQEIKILKAPYELVTREMVENYIRNNLADASIKSIQDEFNLNAPQLYTILTPEKPGSIIQNVRMDMVRKMREEGKPITEIAVATGFSASYLRKIKT